MCSSEFSLSLDMPKIEPSLLQRSHVLGKPTNASSPSPWTGRKNGARFFQQKLGMSPVLISAALRNSLVEGNLGEFRPKLRSFIRVSYSRMAKDGGQTWWFSDVFRTPKSDPHGVGQRIDTAW